MKRKTYEVEFWEISLDELSKETLEMYKRNMKKNRNTFVDF